MKLLKHSTLATALISFLFFACSLGAFGGAWWWVNTLEQRLYETKVAAKRADEERQQFASLEKLALDTKESRARLETYVVTEQGVIGFLSELEGIAKAEGVTPTTNTITTNPVSGDVFEELVVSIGLAGDVESIKETLRRFELMPYQVRIQSVAMRGTKDGMSADSIVVATKLKQK